MSGYARKHAPSQARSSGSDASTESPPPASDGGESFAANRRISVPAQRWLAPALSVAALAWAIGVAVLRLRLPGEKEPVATAVGPDDSVVRDRGPFAAVIAQLDEYFAGTRKKFDVPLARAATGRPTWRCSSGRCCAWIS